MKDKVKVIIYETYLSIIKKSPGTVMFQTLEARIHEEKKDILEKGSLSCAFFVSFILSGFNLIKAPHATVVGTVKDLVESNWLQITEPKEGCVLVWDELDGHQHIGFYVGDNQAISNDSKQKTPQIHHMTFGEEKGNPKRKIISMWWKDGLENM